MGLVSDKDGPTMLLGLMKGQLCHGRSIASQACGWGQAASELLTMLGSHWVWKRRKFP